MKKGTIVGKRQIVLAVLILALAAAVWLNMKYSAANGGFNIAGTDNSSKVLGGTQYVNEDMQNESAVETSAKNDYFESARADRTASREDAADLLKDTINNVSLDAATKQAAVESLAVIAKRIENEASIESLIKAKGFPDAVAIIGDEGITVIVKCDELLSSETLQIQDIVTAQTGLTLEKIKIVTVK